MTRANKTRSALFISILSLLLCVSMLVGTTFAWFTDVAESKGNKIQAGSLQVELWEKDAQGQEQNISESSMAVFNYNLWEPGYSDYTDLIIKNVGTLALKYQMVFQGIATTGNADITEVLDVYVGNENKGTLKKLGETSVLVEGVLDAGGNVNLPRITVKMQETAANKYQGCGVTLDVQVRAIQLNKESDGFGNPDYDINADGYPDHEEFNETITGVDTTLTVPADHTDATDFVYTNGDDTVTVTIPNAKAGEKYNITVKPTAETGNVSVASNQGALSFDISVTDGDDDAVAADIVLDVDKNMPNVKVFHEGTEMAAGSYIYDAENGTLTIKATSYSIYTVRYEYLASVKGHVYGTLAEAFAAAESGDTVNLLTDITTDATKASAADRLTVDKDLTLNLGEYTITVPAELEPTRNWMAINITAGTLTVNATTGGIYSGTESKSGVYCFNVTGTGKLIINSGNYFGGITVAQIDKNAQEAASITVNGGAFEVSDHSGNYGFVYLLNHGDAFYQAYGSHITVNGGTFYGFDPAEVSPEVDQPISFLADGYKTTGKDGWYTVSQADFYKDSNGVWQIVNAAGMQEFCNLVNIEKNTFENETIQLHTDINMYGQHWTPIGGDNMNAYPGIAFKGIFDGNGHTISNLTVTTEGNVNACAGLFGPISHGATIKNVILRDSTIRSTHWAGGIAGYLSDGNGATITNCQVINCTITADYIKNENDSDAKEELGYMVNADKAGGIIGYAASGVFTNNTVKDTKINGYRDLGGIIGHANDASVQVSGNTIDNVTITYNSTYNYKNLTGTDGRNIGEIVGRNNHSIDVTGNTIKTPLVIKAAE